MSFLAIRLIWVGGVIHLVIAAANLLIPQILEYRKNLPKLPAILRQIFIVHSIYICFILLFFAGLSFFFAADLAGKSALGRTLSGFIAGFWLVRIPIQLFYYDAEVKKTHPIGNYAMILALVLLVFIYGFTAVGGVR